jgi:hypothetical protein
MDLPSEPEESDRSDEASAAPDQLRPKSRELPDPDKRGRVYEATRAHAEAEAAERPEQVSEPGQWCDGTGQRGYWAEVPRFLARWVDHENRWPPGRQPAAAAYERLRNPVPYLRRRHAAIRHHGIRA